MHRRIITKEETKDIVERYCNGEFLKNIASRHKIAISTVNDVARRNGSPRRNRAEMKLRKLARDCQRQRDRDER
jgi:ribosomal protein L18E